MHELRSFLKCSGRWSKLHRQGAWKLGCFLPRQVGRCGVWRLILHWRTPDPERATDTDVAGAMKKIAVHLGWESSKVSVHSLRYGGATMLAAARLPQYVIQYFGGWAEGSKSCQVLHAGVGYGGRECFGGDGGRFKQVFGRFGMHPGSGPRGVPR